MIRVRDLRKTYRVHKKEPGLAGSVRSLFVRKWIERDALKGVSLDVESGEIVGLVGANGAGKTTLVKALAGIIYPTSGSASVLGFTPWERKNEFRKQIALIMGQKAQLWWDLPAADCFLLLKEIYQIPEERYHETLDFLSTELRVEELLKIQIRRLSLGERMKMELIAALLHRPRVVFLDEPTIGLDLTAQRSIRNFVRSYSQQHSPAMVLTSHYMEDIEQLCERIVVIREGEIVYDGSLQKIVREYARHKVIVAKIPNPMAGSDLIQLPPDLGRIHTIDDAFIKFQIVRERVAQGAQFVLERYPVTDLTIEEEEIGNVIEAIMRKEP